MSAKPVGPAEFERLMAAVGPFGRERRVVVGVSGGADSLALALLLRSWGKPLAVVVDHGLRPESAAEAAMTLGRLAALGISARCTRLDGLARGPDLGRRAREARYAGLFAVCRLEGLPDLLVAHHAQDQVETMLLRAAQRSGASGLAAMPAIGWRAHARILRPLLSVSPARLRATLADAGQGWVEDPTNRDPTTARGALRAAAIDVRAGQAAAGQAGRARRTSDSKLAEEVGRRIAIHPTGHARILEDPAGGRFSEAAWSAVLWTVSGRRYPPGTAGVERIAASGSGTLHGVLVRGGIVMREPASVGYAVPAVSDVIWDYRFVVRGTVPGAMVDSLGNEAVCLRRRAGLPFAVLSTLPILRVGTDLFMNPKLAYGGIESWTRFDVEFRPTRPLAGAPFAPV